MNVRSATAQDAAGIVALHKAANPHGDWYRNPLQRLGRVPYEELTPLERYFHGGFGMDLSLLRRHLYEHDRRGFPVFVAETSRRIVGEAEVWFDEEPAPFGRYAAVARLSTGSPPDPEVERNLLKHAVERVRKLGRGTLDLPPRDSGAETIATDLGFRPHWDTRTFSANAADVPPPDEEFSTKFLAAEYGDLRDLLLLNHREPARWRFEMLTGLWPAARLAALPDAQKLIAVTVQPESTASFAVLAARREWLDPPVAEVDVWIDPSTLRKPRQLERTFAIASEIARKLGTKRLETYGPPNAAKPLTALGFTGGEASNPWIRLSL